MTLRLWIKASPADDVTEPESWQAASQKEDPRLAPFAAKAFWSTPEPNIALVALKCTLHGLYLCTWYKSRIHIFWWIDNLGEILQLECIVSSKVAVSNRTAVPECEDEAPGFPPAFHVQHTDHLHLHLLNQCLNTGLISGYVFCFGSIKCCRPGGSSNLAGSSKYTTIFWEDLFLAFDRGRAPRWNLSDGTEDISTKSLASKNMP